MIRLIIPMTLAGAEGERGLPARHAAKRAGKLRWAAFADGASFRAACLALAALLAASAAHAESALPLKKGDTVVILGNTFAERMGLFGYFETFLHAAHPDHNLRIRNMGWSADEVALQPRPLNFGELDQKLSQPIANPNPRQTWFNGLGADAIIACFGMTESFRGKEGLSQFRIDLDAYLKHHLSQKYNGRTPPRMLLVSPIAHENLGGHWPDPTAHNEDLAAYVEVMRQIAAANDVPFIDLYTPHKEWIASNPGKKLTINGIHLSEYGDWVVSQWMAQQLGLFDGRIASSAADRAGAFRQLVNTKNDRFYIHFRAVNGEYIYGRRRMIWAQDVPMIPDQEMLRLGEVDEDYDKKVWSAPKPAPAAVWADLPKQ